MITLTCCRSERREIILRGATETKKGASITSARSARSSRRKSSLLALAVLTCLAAAPLFAQPRPARAGGLAGSNGGDPLAAAAPRKVILVIIDRIGLEDLTAENAPNILRLANRGEIGLMNARVRYDQYGQGGYVTIGAGGRAIGGPNSELAFNEGELLRTPSGREVPAGQLYRERTGLPAPPGSVLNLYVEEMKKKSDVPQASGVPGLLGKAAREAGRRVAVLGNADSLAPATQVLPGNQLQYVTPVLKLAGSDPEATLLHREVSCIAMDDEGRVPGGDVASDLYRTSASAAGVTTDFDALLERARAELQSADLLVVDMGQTSRVDEQADFYSDHALKKARGRALKMCDAALGRMLEFIDLGKDVVAVCVPTPTRKMILSGDLLTPIVFAGPGFRSGEQLSSPTTRRTGLASNFDVAPTALDLLGAAVPAEMDGRPLTAVSGGELVQPLPEDQLAAPSGQPPKGLAGLRTFEDRAAGASVSRRAMVRVYAVVAISIVVLFLLVALIREEWVRGHRLLWSVALMSLLAGPLAYLVVPAFGVPALYWLLPAAVLLSVLLAFASLLLGRRDPCPLWPMTALSGVTAFVILLDIALGSPLMTFSPFGSDVMMADRYYGVGNLFMGFAVGSALLFACLAVTLLKSLKTPARRYGFCVAVFAVTAFLVGFGRLGANFGGLIAALVGSIVTLLKLEGGRLGAKKLALGFAVLVVLLVLMLGADVLLPGTSSHAGRAVARAEGGGSSIAAQVGRKLAANWSLTWSSIWRLLLLALLVAGLGLNWRYHLFAELKTAMPAVYAAFVGMGFALPFALLLNDSGIEAAAAIAVFLFVPYLLMLTWRLAADSHPNSHPGVRHLDVNDLQPVGSDPDTNSHQGA